ncbi:Bug family tripartite tricarboxylate transporter substrate binding protein [Advenella kashmirensis]|uniref:Bug family tripartite tricarboxylate transporter substrate binding protein n=1 Tax=Advenella kashmirensis TaxID=310575 RepID=UPI0009DAE2B0
MTRHLFGILLTAGTVVCSSLLASSSVAAAASTAGEMYPTKPIRIIVPYTPGGNTDILGRLIAEHLGKAWGIAAVVENRPGAGGTIGVNTVVKAKPDGYTMVLGAFGNILVAQSLYKDLPYDPVTDLEPVILLATPPTILTATAGLPVQDVQA